MARLYDALARCAGFFQPRSSERAAFQSFSGIQGSFLCEALRDSPDKAGAREALRFRLFSSLGLQERLARKIQGTCAGIEFRKIHGLAAGAGYYFRENEWQPASVSYSFVPIILPLVFGSR